MPPLTRRPSIIRQLRDTQKELTEEIARLRDEADDAQNTANAARNEAAVLVESVERQKDEATKNLQATITNLETEINHAEQTLKEKRAEKAVLDLERVALNRSISVLKGEITAINESRNDVQKALEVSARELRTVQENITAAKDALEAAQQEITATRKERDEAFDETDKAKETLAKEQTVLAGLRKEIARENDQLQALIAKRHGLNEREKFIKARFAQLNIPYR